MTSKSPLSDFHTAVVVLPCYAFKLDTSSSPNISPEPIIASSALWFLPLIKNDVEILNSPLVIKYTFCIESPSLNTVSCFAYCYIVKKKDSFCKLLRVQFANIGCFSSRSSFTCSFFYSSSANMDWYSDFSNVTNMHTVLQMIVADRDWSLISANSPKD